MVDAQPKRVFERAALRAAHKWEFEAPQLAGLTESQQGTFRIRFSLN